MPCSIILDHLPVWLSLSVRPHSANTMLSSMKWMEKRSLVCTSASFLAWYITHTVENLCSQCKYAWVVENLPGPVQKEDRDLGLQVGVLSSHHPGFMNRPRVLNEAQLTNRWTGKKEQYFEPLNFELLARSHQLVFSFSLYWFESVETGIY